MRTLFLSALILALAAGICLAESDSAATSAAAQPVAPVSAQPAASDVPAATISLPRITDEKDVAIVEAFRKHARTLAAKLTVEHFKGVKETEMLCWLELKHMNLSLVAYELSGDVTHLRDFAAAQENLRAALTKGPDGFLGWYGQAIEARRDPADPEHLTDDIQTSFRAVWVLSRFVEIVDREPRLKEEFGQYRAPLVDLMQNHLIKKWNDRGYWVDLGTDGGIYRMNNIKPPRNAISLPWEKLSIAVDGLLAYYRATGDPDAMQRIVKIGTLFKRRLQLVDDRYQWYRWVPLGKWDVNPENPAKWGTWIGRSPIAGWYGVEVGIAVAIYQHGLVFDRTDIDRFVRTQVGVCWNGDTENPVYLNCEGKPSDRKGQRYIALDLAPFSPKFADFVFTGTLQQERFDKRDSDWQGGVLAAEWLTQKYLVMPACVDGKPVCADVGRRFLADDSNAKLVEKLKFTVTAPGYKVPLVPAQMDPMPEAPDPRGI